MDPLLTNDGKPYGPLRYKSIIQERYIICKNANISYSDTGKMTPKEREYILEFIKEEAQRANELMKENLPK